MEKLLSDIRIAFRSLRKSPGFLAVALLSMAFGIGVNSFIYSMYSSVFLRKPPVEEPARLVNLYTADDDLVLATFSYPDYEDLRQQSTDVFSDVLVYNTSLAINDEGGESGYLFGESVSGNYWDVLGIPAYIGRTFTPADDDPESPPVAMIGYARWKNQFGEDPDIIGKSIRLNGTPFTIVGVAPRSFRGSLPVTDDFWYPIRQIGILEGDLRDLSSRSSRNLWLKARLRPGVDFETASAAVQTIGQRLTEQYPETNEDRTFHAIPFNDVAIMPVVDKPMKLVGLFLMIVVGMTLLIACTNLAGMLLARAASRRQEVAVRLALGASRSTLIRQLLTESLLLSVAGGVLGLLVADVLVRLTVAFQPPIPIPVNLDLRLDANVVWFTAFLSIATGLLFGLLPALQSTRPNLVDSLKSGDRGRGRLSRLRMRSGLVVAQVTVSALLLVCSGLFLRSLGQARTIDPGFDLRDGIAMTIETAFRHVEPEEARTLFHTLRDRVAALPGIESAALIEFLPLGMSIQTREIWPVSDLPVPEDGVDVDNVSASTGYFRTVGIPLLAGREFGPEDTPDSRPVAIVNKAFADRWWPDEDPVGKQFRRSKNDDTLFQVVGMVPTGKYRTLGERPRPFIWFNMEQERMMFGTVVARTSGPADSYLPVLRDLVKEVDPNLPIFELKTIRTHLDFMLFLPSMFAILLTGLGLLALFLGAIGLYGVVAYDVARRRREIGIRMALGARSKEVVAWVVGGGVKMVVLGLVLGLGLAAAVTGQLTALLYGVSPLDPITFGGIAILLLAITWGATWGPARRASRLDPMIVLREE